MEVSQEAAALVAGLHSSLRNGRKMAQAQAAAALARLCDHPSAADAVASAGAISPLLQLLGSSSAAVQRQAASALFSLAALSASARASVAAEGGIPILVRLLSSSDALVQLSAAEPLCNLAAHSKEHCTAIAAEGAVPALVQLCSGSSGRQAAEMAAGVLQNLCTAPSCTEALTAGGAIEVMDSLLSSSSADSSSGSTRGPASTFGGRSSVIISGSSASGGGGYAAWPSARIVAIKALHNLALHGPDMQAAITAVGAPARLVQTLQTGSPEEAWEAARALDSLAADALPSACTAIAEAGGIEALAGQLASTHHPDAPGNAASILVNLSYQSRERSSAMLAAGHVPRLPRLLGGAACPKALASAANAVANITGNCADGPAAVADAGGVEVLLRALGTCSDANALNAAASLAHNLAFSGHFSQEQAARAIAALEPLGSSADERVRQCADQARKSIMLYALSGMPASLVVELLAAGKAAKAAGVPGPGPAEALGAAAAPAPQRGGRQPPRPPRVCAAPGCGATAGLRRCGGCGSVRYCSEACCKAHWRAHKADCRRLQAERAAQPAVSAAQLSLDE